MLAINVVVVVVVDDDDDDGEDRLISNYCVPCQIKLRKYLYVSGPHDTTSVSKMPAGTHHEDEWRSEHNRTIVILCSIRFLPRRTNASLETIGSNTYATSEQLIIPKLLLEGRREVCSLKLNLSC